MRIFLFSLGLERPSQLGELIDQFDRSTMIYYLRHVCIPEIMEQSSVFRGTGELLSERLAVLAMLVRLDAERVQDYEAETRRITRDQLIQRAARDVEQSKLYVDIPAIRRWAEQTLRDEFNRYRALRAAGVAGGLILFSDIIFIIFDNIRRHSGIPASPKVWLKVTRTESRLRIKVQNEIAAGVRSPLNEDRVDAIRERILSGDYSQSVKSEGGSGLIKLRKIIGLDKNPPLTLEFGFLDDSAFFVDLELSLREAFPAH